MAAKKTRLQLMHRVEGLVEELDRMVWDLVFYEEQLSDTEDSRAAVGRGAIRASSKRVQTVQKKCNEIWRLLEQYRNRVVKERP